jgi:hypothetical protein
MRALLLTFFCTAAFAHRGSVVQLAIFTQPPPLLTAPDAGTNIPTADANYDVAWTDSDSDPTGRYFLYYMDHPPPSGSSTADVAALAEALPLGGIWAACDCIDGAQVVCPDAGVRDCRNSIPWDTSGLAPGAYWLVAIDNDPPYYLYSVSESPVRVAHGGSAPPGAYFILPNGIGSADESYKIQWVAEGDAPLAFDLAWGKNVEPDVAQPPTPIATNVAATDEGGRKFSYLWDTSQLASGDVYVQVTVRDASGRSSIANSLNLKIFHPAAPPDLSRPDMAMAPRTAASCQVGDSGNVMGPLFAGGFLALLLLLLARRSAR